MSALERAAAAFNAGRFAQAARLAGLALARGEDPASALLFRGMARLSLGRRAPALSDLRRAARLRPGAAERAALAAAERRPELSEALALRAAQAEKAGRLEDASRLWRRSWEAAPQPRAASALARLELWRGRWSSAARLAGRAGDPLTLGAALVGLGRAREALGALARAARREPARPEPWLWRAVAHRRLSEGKAARACALKAAARTPSSWAAAALLQCLRLERGLPADAAALVLVAARLGASEGERRRLLGSDPERQRRVVSGWLRAARGNLTDAPTRLLAGRLRRVRPAPTRREAGTRAQALLLSLGPAAAEAALMRLARRPGQRGQALSHLGELRLWQGRWAQARALLRRALACDPRVRWPRVGLGAAELLAGRAEAALAALAEASAAGAVDSVVVPWRAEALLAARRPDALRLCRRAARLFPKRPSALVNLALAFHAAGRERQARALLALLEREAPAWLSAARRRARGSSAGEILLAARALLRGNRSSWLPFYWDGGRPRAIELGDAAAREAARLLR